MEMKGRLMTIMASLLGLLFIVGAALMSRGAIALRTSAHQLALNVDGSVASPSDRMCVVQQSSDKIYFISCGGIY